MADPILEGITGDMILSEGQFQIAQFPLWASATFQENIEARMAIHAAQVKASNSALYATADATLQALVRQAVIYLTCSSLWQTILSTMTGFDAEALPPEFVSYDTAIELRDSYARMATELLQPFASMMDSTADDDPNYSKPYFGTAGLDQDDERTSSLVEKWISTGALPE